MDGSGDSRIQWDPAKADEVDAAKAQFDSLTKKGYNAYAMRRNGDKGEQVREFDPEAAKIILAPPIRGG
jgi:hypothetical protein